jgi:hypothetical protein
MEKVDDRVAPIRARRISGRQINEDVAIRGIALEIPFQRFAVDFDLCPRAFLCFIPPLGSACGGKKHKDTRGNKNGRKNFHWILLLFSVHQSLGRAAPPNIRKMEAARAGNTARFMPDSVLRQFIPVNRYEYALTANASSR